MASTGSTYRAHPAIPIPAGGLTFFRTPQLTQPPPPQRNLNNAFAYDLVPAPSVVAAALNAARRVNDFATAVRVFEGTISRLQLSGRGE